MGGRSLKSSPDFLLTYCRVQRKKKSKKKSEPEQGKATRQEKNKDNFQKERHLHHGCSDPGRGDRDPFS